MDCCIPVSSSIAKTVGYTRSDVFEEIDFGKKRSRTDAFFLYLLVFYVAFLAISAGVAAGRANPKRLVYGFDDYGNVCGDHNIPIPTVRDSGQDMTYKKFLVIDTSCDWKDCIIKKTCKATCPVTFIEGSLGHCYSPMLSDAADSISMQKIVTDINACWLQIFIMCGISIGLSVTFLLILRYWAAVFIKTLLILFPIVVVGLTILSWVQWNASEVGDHSKDETYWLYCAISSTTVMVIYFVVLLIMMKRIPLIIELFKETSIAVEAMPMILLQPIATFIAAALVCGFAIFGFICIESTGQPSVNLSGEVTFSIPIFFQVLRWFHLFGFLWMTQFVFACQHLVVAGAVSKWYFTRDKAKLSSPILQSVTTTIRFHLGSVSLGALLIALIQLVQSIIRKMQHSRLGFIFVLLKCMLVFIEAAIAFISKNAYIIIAIFGEGFCKSGKHALALITANLLSIAALESVGNFVLYTVKCVVILVVAFAGVGLVNGVEGVHYNWAPVITGCIIALFIIHSFISVYEMAIGTLLVCYCKDCEINDGTSRPYYMASSLMMCVEKCEKQLSKKETQNTNSDGINLINPTTV